MPLRLSPCGRRLTGNGAARGYCSATSRAGAAHLLPGIPSHLVSAERARACASHCPRTQPNQALTFEGMSSPK